MMSMFGGVNSLQANQQAGLPYAGVPEAMQGKVRAVLEREPEHPEPDVEFSHRHVSGPRFNLRSFLGPHRGRLFTAAFLVVVEAVALQAGPLLVRTGIDDGVRPGRRNVLVIAALAYGASILIAALVSRSRIRFTGGLGERLMYELRIRVFSHMQRQPLAFYTGEKAGVLMTRMTSDIEALSMLFQEGLINFAVQGLTVTVITVVLFVLNPMLALITVVAVVPATVLLTLWFRGVSQTGYDRARERIADLLADLQESLAGIRVIAAFNRRRHNVIHHRNVVGDFESANLFTGRAASIYAPGAEAIGIFAQAVLLLVGGRMVLDGSMTLGELTAFGLYLTAFFAPIQQLVQLYNSYQQGQAAMRKLGDLLDLQPEVAEAPEAVDLPPLEGAIELRNVTFGYNSDAPVLTGIDLKIAAGQSLAVVGPTGAGKSTIAKLIARFYDPDDGSVLIDGFDLRDATLRSLRTQLGIVPQEPFLFHGTIRDNIAFARPDADEDELLAAAASVGLQPLLDKLADGIDSPVHERGASLSAGERQLLALARAFISAPRVLVLDEATSNLDLQSETAVENALDLVLHGRTAIIIAHRLATAMRADRIAVVAEGGIAELGTHEELIKLGGRYAEMYRTWVEHGGQSGMAADADPSRAN